MTEDAGDLLIPLDGDPFWEEARRFSLWEAVEFLTTSDPCLALESVARRFQRSLPWTTNLINLLVDQGRIPFGAFSSRLPARKLPPKIDGPGSLYLMRADSGLLKVGISVSPNRRRREVERAERCSVKLLAVRDVPNMLAAERFAHAAISAHRVRGEWFRLPPSILCSLLSYLQEGVWQ